MSAKNTKLQNFNINDQSARYVRIIGHGNSANTWNSLTEVSINTIGGSTDTSTPSDTVLSKTTVVMQKQNTSFSIDGNGGAIEGQQVYLWDTNRNNVNQQWVESKLSNGYYVYGKTNTSLCLDGGNGAARRQPVTLEVCDNSDKNQQWRKVSNSNGSFRLEKRDTSYSIDGNGGAARRQAIYLWNSSSTNVNQQWQFFTAGAVDTPTAPQVPVDNPEPVGDLDPGLPPGQNFDLGQWKMTRPSKQWIG
jgi:hypothetical protein